MQIPMIIYSITILLFLVVILITPFREGADIARGLLRLPESFTLYNFQSAWETGLNLALRNSLLLAAVTCGITIVLGGLAGYAYSLLKFPLRNFFYQFSYVMIYISIVLICLPLFLQYRDLRLNNTYWGALIIFVGIRLPFSIFLFRNFFDEFSKELLEAGRIDGLGHLGTLLHIVFPLSKGVSVTVMIFNFTAVWTDLLVGLLFLQKSEMLTIMVKVMYIFNVGPMATKATPLGQGFAGLLIGTVPILILYAFTKKHYIEGLTMGSIK
jgi:ABC-type glycerol-3-phosphate transport system permease component